MCGIAGLLAPKDGAEDSLRRMIQMMIRPIVHRGPDAEGTWTEHGIALGHRRLSILDLSPAGAQPMHSACGRYVIAFNGEIYNHLDLRRELEAAGAAPEWRGHSDTETLLAGIAHWGLDETLRRAAGMFAIALWDRRVRRMSLVRDRIGEKPLYWGWAGSSLVFASELKALRAHPDVSREICRSALALYFRFGYVPAPRCIHPGLFKVEPGCVIEIAGDVPTTPSDMLMRPGEARSGISIRRWWSLTKTIDDGAADVLADETAAVEQLEATLTRAVGRQMLADVPLGAFLSGGIDSSTIVALMQKQSLRPVKTFTIGFDVPEFDESPHARAVARHLGTDHTEMRVTEADARAVIPELPEMYDEPFGDSSQIPTHLVCRAARAEVTVALTGDAGDELFGGYNRYFWGPSIWSRLDWMPHPARRALGKSIEALPIYMWDGLGRLLPSRHRPSRFGDKAHRLAHRLKTVRTLDDLYRSLVSEWPGEDIVNGARGDLRTLLDDPVPDGLASDPAGRMMLQDMRTYLPDDILCKVDRAAMAVSLETRVPFLDPDVVALSARMPEHMKIRGGQGKWALRQILFDHVPRQLIERPKTGFGIPVGDWLCGPLRDWAEDLLSHDSLTKDGLLDPRPIRAAWNEHLSRRRDWTHRLWIVLMLMAWLRQNSK